MNKLHHKTISLTILFLSSFVYFGFLNQAIAKQLQVFEVSKKDFQLKTSTETFPVVTGKILGDKQIEGDRKTPEGIYYVTGEISKGLLTPEHGKFAFNLSFPNAWDKLHNVNGSNIWLHGTINDDRLSLKTDTRGCVALKNSDLEKLVPVLKNDLVFVRIWKDEIPQNIPQFDPQILANWAKAWSEKNLESFSQFYAPTFRADGLNYEQFMAKKKRLFQTLKYIQVESINPIFLYHPKYSMVIFHQVYKSSGINSEGTKVFYFENNKIVAENFTNQINLKEVKLH